MTKSIKKREYEAELPCTLTKKERLEYADKLGEAAKAVSNATKDKKGAAAKLKSVQADHEQLSTIVSSGVVYRMVTVREEVDLDAGKKLHIRTDTGEITYEGELTDADRQSSLLGGES